MALLQLKGHDCNGRQMGIPKHVFSTNGWWGHYITLVSNWWNRDNHLLHQSYLYLEDFPVSWVVLFYNPLQLFMQNYILNPYGIIDQAECYIIRYEIQNRGWLHTHIMLWIHKDDIKYQMKFVLHIEKRHNKCRWQKSNVTISIAWFGKNKIDTCL